ncbi:MAG TPA: serine hydrolase [Ilumatobacteraceae bacterium]|nr:serine hydrolase [Ilumatobacteraceae bacterium]
MASSLAGAAPSGVALHGDIPAGVGMPSVDARSVAVYDATAGRWLGGSNADAQIAVGSVMKLLTSYVVMQAGDLSKVVTVPAMDVNFAESSIGLYQGQKLARDVLLRAMMIVSANDAARALAVDVGGSTDNFVAKMNAAATSLGLANTHAANPIGLDATGAYSSARDMVALAELLMRDAAFSAAVARTSANMHGTTFPATNKLLGSYQGANGVKTGHTTQAGYCIVASATRNGRTIYVALFGAASDAARTTSTTALFDWAFAQA